MYVLILMFIDGIIINENGKFGKNKQFNLKK